MTLNPVSELEDSFLGDEWRCEALGQWNQKPNFYSTKLLWVKSGGNESCYCRDRGLGSVSLSCLIFSNDHSVCREFDCELELISSGICQLQHISQAFDDAIVQKER